MITSINEILTEWAYRTKDGLPNPKSMAHQILLEGILKNYGWSVEARAELLNNLNEIAPTAMVKNPNPKGRSDKVQYRYAKQWLDDNPDADPSDDYKNDVGGKEEKEAVPAIDQLDIKLSDLQKTKLEAHQKTTTDWLRSGGKDKAIKTGDQPTPEAQKAHKISAVLLEKLWGGTPLDPTPSERFPEGELVFLSKWVRVVEPTENAPNRFRIYVAREENNFSRGKGLYAERMGKKSGFGDSESGAKLQKWMQDNGVATQRTSTYGGKLSTANQTFLEKDKKGNPISGKTKLLQPKLTKKDVVRAKPEKGEKVGKVKSVKISKKLTLTRVPKQPNETSKQRKQRLQNNNSLEEYAELIENGDLDFIDMNDGLIPDTPENRVEVIKQSLGRIAERFDELGRRPISGVPEGPTNPPPVDTVAQNIINELKAFSQKNPNGDPPSAAGAKKWFDDLKGIMMKVATHETLEQGWANYAEVYDAIREMHAGGKGTADGKCALLPESTTLETVDILTISENQKGTNKIVTIDGRSVKKGAGGPSQLTAKVSKSGMKPVKAHSVTVGKKTKTYPALTAEVCKTKCIALSEKHDDIYEHSLPNDKVISATDKQKEAAQQDTAEKEIKEMARELGVSEDYIEYIKKQMNQRKTTKAGKVKLSPVEAATKKIMQDRAKSTDKDGNPLSTSTDIKNMITRRMENYYLYQALSHRAYNQNLSYQNFANDSISVKMSKGKPIDINVNSSTGIATGKVGEGKIAWPKFEFNIGFSVEGRSTNPGGGRFHNEEEFPAWGTV